MVVTMAVAVPTVPRVSVSLALLGVAVSVRVSLLISVAMRVPSVIVNAPVAMVAMFTALAFALSARHCFSV